MTAERDPETAIASVVVRDLLTTGGNAVEMAMPTHTRPAAITETENVKTDTLVETAEAIGSGTVSVVAAVTAAMMTASTGGREILMKTVDAVGESDVMMGRQGRNGPEVLRRPRNASLLRT